MLGATTTGIRGSHVSRPPKAGELNKAAREDWVLGEEILRTCLETHRTATCAFLIKYCFLENDLRDTFRGLSPEIVYFYKPDEVTESDPKNRKDWYIKHNEYLSQSLASSLSFRLTFI